MNFNEKQKLCTVYGVGGSEWPASRRLHFAICALFADDNRFPGNESPGHLFLSLLLISTGYAEMSRAAAMTHSETFYQIA